MHCVSSCLIWSWILIGELIGDIASDSWSFMICGTCCGSWPVQGQAWTAKLEEGKGGEQDWLSEGAVEASRAVDCLLHHVACKCG